MTKILLDTTHIAEDDKIQVTVLLDEDGKEIVASIEIINGGASISCGVSDADLARLRVVNRADLIASVLNALLLHTDDETEIPLVADHLIEITL